MVVSKADLMVLTQVVMKVVSLVDLKVDQMAYLMVVWMADLMVLTQVVMKVVYLVEL